MATVGGLVVHLALNTVGLSAGLVKAQAELAQFQAFATKTMSNTAGTRAAYAALSQAQNAATLATERLAVAQAHLNELQAMGVSASTLAAAQNAVAASALGLTGAQNAEAVANERLAASQLRLTASTEALNVAEMNLFWTKNSQTASSYTLAAANSRVTAAQAGLASAQTAVSANTAALAASQGAVVTATNRLSVAQVRLNEVQASGTASASSLAAAQSRLRVATLNLAEADAAVVAARQAALASTTMAPAKTFPMIAGGATLASLAILGIGAASVKAAAQFEYEMKLIRVQAGANAKELTFMSEALLKMAPAVKTGPDELAKGLFHIESVGKRSAEALDILTVAAKGAIVGNADLESVTNALIAARLSDIKGVQDMTEAMGTLNGIVGTGNLRMQDLASSLSSGILSTAKTFGLSIQDVGAALATMADQGIPAEEAATRLRITIALLGAPTKIAAHELSRIGLTDRSIADEMRGPNGLAGALRMLRDHMDAAGLDATEQAQLLKNAFGGSRSSAGILVLINSLTLLDQKMAVIKNKSKSFDEDFAQASKTATAHFKELEAIVEVLKVRIGNGLLPVLIPFASFLGEILKHTEVMVPLFVLLTATITGLAVKALARLVISFILMLANIGANLVAMWALAGATAGVTVSSGAATTAINAQTVAMSGATVAAGGMATAMGGVAAAGGAAAAGATGAAGAAGLLGTVVGALALPVTIAVAAIALLVLNFDRVAQGARVAAFAAFGLKKALVDALAFVPGPQQEGFKQESQRIQQQMNQLAGVMKTAEDEIRKKAGDSGADATASYAAGIASALPEVVDGTSSLVKLFGTSLAGVEQAAADSGSKAMAEMAKAILDAQTAPLDAFRQLKEMIANEITPTAEIARLVGELSSDELARGLTSNDAAVAAQAEALKKSIIERLDDITDGAYTAGTEAAGAWREGFAKLRAVTALGLIALPGLRDSVLAKLDAGAAAYEKLSSEWKNHLAPSAEAAAAALRELEDSIASGSASIPDMAAKIVSKFAGNLEAIKGIGETAGADLMEAIAKGIESGRDKVNSSLSSLHQMLVDTMSKSGQIAYLLAALAGEDIAAGLASSDPKIYAEAVAARQIIMDQLDILTNGAYSAGENAGANYMSGWTKAMHDQEYLSRGLPVPSMSSFVDAADLAAGKKKYNDWLKEIDERAKSATGSLTGMASAARAAMTSAFDAIKAKAHEFFDAVHEGNLQAIRDAHDHKNALLDAKEALIQKPVTAAQKALDFQRQAQEEWRLRKAIAEATDPASRRDAILALQDFLAQKNIDMMQDEVDAQTEQLDAEKKANDEQEAEAVKAENKRYEQQKKDFDRQLTALERFLKTHPAQWRKTNNEILALLAEFGVSYKTAGSAIGADFVDGLREQIEAAQKAAADLAAAGTPGAAGAGGFDTGGGNTTIPPGSTAPGSTIGGSGGGGSAPKAYGLGAYDLPTDQMAMIHAHEMILQPNVAAAVRQALGGRGVDAIPALIRGGDRSMTASLALARAFSRAPIPDVSASGRAPGSDRGGDRGGGTIIVQVGPDKLAEVTDRSLYVQSTVYGQTRRLHASSQR